MKALLKTRFKFFLLIGLGYAGLMAGGDLFDGKSFDLWKCVWSFLSFGLFMTLMIKNNVEVSSEKTPK